MAYAAANIVDFVRGFGQRREEKKIKNALTNYLDDPLASIQAVNAINPEVAIPLKQDYQKRQIDEQQRQATATKATEVAAQERQKRVLGSVTSMTQMLGQARDTGQDVGSVFDQISGVLTGGLGMTPEEVADWKGKIVANPRLIDVFHDKAKEKLQVLTPGSMAIDPTGKVIRENPVAVRTVVMRDANGNSQLVAVDADGNLVGGGGASPGAPSAPGAPAAYSGPKSIDPTARGIRNGNPGNIKDGKWAKQQPGYLGNDGQGFARFAPGAGDKAAEANLTRYFQSGKNTVNRIIDGTGPTNPGWLGSPTPGNENSVASRANYKAYIAGRLGVDPDAPIPPSRIPEIRQAISEFENGGQAPSSGGSGILAATNAVKPTKPGYRVATEAEKTTAGVDAKLPYQISGEGKMELIGPAPSKAAGAKVSPEQLEAQKTDTMSNLRSMVRESKGLMADPSFNRATGSIQGRLPSVFQGSADFDDRLQSFRDKTVIYTIQSLKALSKTGATGFGSLTEKEGSRLENSKGSLRQTSPRELRRTLQDNIENGIVGIGVIKLNGAVPSDAIRLLVKQPGLARDFDAKYGAGSANKVLEEAR